MSKTYRRQLKSTTNHLMVKKPFLTYPLIISSLQSSETFSRNMSLPHRRRLPKTDSKESGSSKLHNKRRHGPSLWPILGASEGFLSHGATSIDVYIHMIYICTSYMCIDLCVYIYIYVCVCNCKYTLYTSIYIYMVNPYTYHRDIYIFI